MKEPLHPVRPAFEQAADAMEAWRQQQIAALTQTQRQIYDEARRKADERAKAKDRELAERHQSDVRERMRRKLIETPELTLTPGRKPVRMTEALARQLVEEHFQMGERRDVAVYVGAVLRAETAAIGEIDHEHQRERQAAAIAQRGILDERLRDFEQARNTSIEPRKDFAHKAADGQAKTDFEKASRNPDAKSPAIARAIEKARRKEAERDRDRDLDHGRER